MAYTVHDYETKKALKQDLTDGKDIKVYQPGGLSEIPRDGKVYLEGPHYPRPHKWYAIGMMENGRLVKVR